MHPTTGLLFNQQQTENAYKHVWELLKQSDSPVFHAIGNHDLFNFTPEDLREMFNGRRGSQVEASPHSYHVRRNIESCF